MRYISTRGQAPALNFEQVLLAGLASDGGLYVPETLPHFSNAEITAMAALDYPQLAQKIITPFVHDCIPADDLRAMVVETYSEFRHNAVAPLAQIGSDQWVLELFHAPAAGNQARP